jgi:molybdopterin/thiamine biosynthesis adenylyltransferase
VTPGSGPCYRCVFEDVPTTAAGNCDTIGVLGPVVGVAGAWMAEQALRLLNAEPAAGFIYTLEGKTGRLRAVSVRRRRGCPLCGEHAAVLDTAWERYESPPCSSVR